MSKTRIPAPRPAGLPLRAVLYARLSQSKESNADGIDNQLDELRAVAAREGWVVVAEHVDEGLSAFKGKVRRPGFAAVVSQVRAGEVDIIAARHSDRLTRDVLEFSLLARDCKAAGVRVWAGGLLDLDTPGGKMLGTITSAVAEYESEIRQERLLLKQHALAMAGKVGGGGTRPFGFKADRKMIVESEAAVIREVTGRVIAGHSIRSEVARLNDTGVATVTGARWSPQVLTELLRSPRIAGLREHHGQTVATAVDWKPIIGLDEHHAVRALTDPNRRYRRAGRTYLLTGGVAVCSTCRIAMRAQPRGDGARAIVCSRNFTGEGCARKILADPLEALVVEALFAATKGSKVNKFLKRPDTAPILARLADLAEQESTLTASMFAKDMSPSAFGEAIRVVGEARRQEEAEAELAACAAPSPLADLGEPLRVAWPSLSADQQRSIVRACVSAVEVGPARRGLNKFDEGRVVIKWTV